MAPVLNPAAELPGELRAFRLSVGGIPGAPARGAVILLQLDTLGITKLKIV